MKQTTAIRGIIPALLTPMHDDESVNTTELGNQVERMIAGGAHGLFFLGTNGEAYILGEAEKLTVLEAGIAQAKGRLPVYAGTGCISTADTVRLSKRAEAMGADVLSIITPSFALASQEELYEHYAAVARQVSTPIVLYNIPARTGNKLLPETVARLAKDIDVIAGVKDSSGDLENLKAYLRQTRELDKAFAVLSGNDALILPCLKEGGAGGITGCANVYPATMSSIYNLFMAGKHDEAETTQRLIESLRAVFALGNPNTIVKTATELLGHPVGKCRAPFRRLSPECLTALQKVLDDNAAKGIM
jgi:4-hydroxy-tetrahydrodipicolinate synthase